MTANYLPILQGLNRLGRPAKRRIVLAIDLILATCAAVIAYSLRVGVWVVWDPAVAKLIALSTTLFLPIFAAYGVYSAIFRYAGSGMIRNILYAGVAYGATLGLLVASGIFSGIPRTVGLIQPVLFVGFVIIARLLMRYAMVDLLGRLDFRGDVRTLVIYGAGDAGQQTASAMRSDPAFRVIGFVDDDARLHGQRLDGLPVFHSSALPEVIQRFDVTDILLALPRVGRAERHEIVQKMEALKLRVKTLPPLTDIVDGRVSLSDIRDLDVEDLLGRDPVAPNELLLGRTVVGKTILVTGAGGSIGSELCRQILAIGAARLVLFDMSEYALYAIDKELRETTAQRNLSTQIETYLGSVRDDLLLEKIMASSKPDTVYHAAAYKHVPLVEANALEGIRNNVLGTAAVVAAAERHKVADFILISTDKAVRPTNVMGASKRAAELVVQAFAEQGNRTRFSMVRFGNVLGSSGSVVPLFRAQIAAGGPITVTHRNVTRYFMTIPEAAQLVIQAAGLARGGEVFVLDMGESVQIIELARTMVHLSGLSVRDAENPYGDIAIEEVGLRPGEKMYEELLISGAPQQTKHPRIMMAHETSSPMAEVKKAMAVFRESGSSTVAIEQLRALVPEFGPTENAAASA